MASYKAAPGAIDRIAKSAEVRQLCLGAANGIAATAEGIMPEASYSVDAVTGRKRVRARVRAYPPDWTDRDARLKYFEHPPIFGITPRL